MGPISAKKGFPKGRYAACKCWQSAFMHFVSLRQQLYFFLSVGWVGGFPAHDLGDSLPVASSLHGKARWCSAQLIHVLPAWSNVIGGYAELGATTRAHVKYTYLLSHYIPSFFRRPSPVFQEPIWKVRI